MTDEFDLAVIGAGVNGAGIARDAAMRGLNVVVFEQNDLCSGTSSASSRLIHGGLRYLEYGELPLVYESLHERRYLRVIASHLVKPLRISIPIYETARRGRLLIRLGMIAYDLLSWNKRMPRHEMLSGEEMQSGAPGLKIQGLRAGARYHDAQVTFAERLVLENLLAARDAGASIRLYQRVTSINVSNGQVDSLDVVGTNSSETDQVRASVVVNAAGPWVDEVLGVAAGRRGARSKPLIGGTKGSHIVVRRFEGAPRDAFYVEAQADGRPFFIIPWSEQLLIGTTDIRCDEPLETIRASDAEIDYLLAETNRVFPIAELDVDDIHYAYAGVRPLPRREKGPESAITRKHIIRANRDVAKGMLSIIGGKLTTYRHLAEQTVDKAGRLLRRRLPECRTHDTPLPGGWGIDEARDAVSTLATLSDAGRQRLLDIYGGRATKVVELVKSNPGPVKTFGERGRVLEAEVAFAIRAEMATTLSDIVFRRLMVGFDADQGRPDYDRIADLAADELGWTDRERDDHLESLIAYSDSLRVRSL